MKKKKWFITLMLLCATGFLTACTSDATFKPAAKYADQTIPKGEASTAPLEAKMTLTRP